jgi:hypothetical protein
MIVTMHYVHGIKLIGLAMSLYLEILYLILFPRPELNSMVMMRTFGVERKKDISVTGHGGP